MPSNPPEGSRGSTPLERRVRRRALLLLPRVELALRRRGYEGARQRIGGELGSPPPADEVPVLVAASVRGVAAAATNLPLPAACLARSVTLWALLRRQGIDSSIVLAVRKGDGPGAPDAHAWVEREGVPLNESPEVIATYLRLDRSRPA